MVVVAALVVVVVVAAVVAAVVALLDAKHKKPLKRFVNSHDSHPIDHKQLQSQAVFMILFKNPALALLLLA